MGTPCRMSFHRLFYDAPVYYPLCRLYNTTALLVSYRDSWNERAAGACYCVLGARSKLVGGGTLRANPYKRLVVCMYV